jgi:hypothetical protein
MTNTFAGPVAGWSVGLLCAAAVVGCGQTQAVSHGATDSGADPACQSILSQSGEDTGFEMCADGTTRRRAALQCPWRVMSADTGCPATGDCSTDEECTQNLTAFDPKGYCADAHQLKGYCGCFSGCREDSDCAVGSICVCIEGEPGSCLPAKCKTNADCGAGLGCVASAQGVAGKTCNQTSNASSPPMEFYVCQTTSDECNSNRDCFDGGASVSNDAGEIEAGACVFDGSHRACGLFCAYPP